MTNTGLVERVDAPVSLSTQLSALRPQLLRYAMQKTHNPSIAEDLVQETMLAVLESPTRYAGLSTLSTYVIGILKFKLVDHFRYESRFFKGSGGTDVDGICYESDQYLEQMLSDGENDQSNCLHDPEALLEQKRTMHHLERALQKLPERSARALTLFDCLGYESDEICEELSLTRNNLMVIIHRARNLIRQNMPRPCYAYS